MLDKTSPHSSWRRLWTETALQDQDSAERGTWEQMMPRSIRVVVDSHS